MAETLSSDDLKALATAKTLTLISTCLGIAGTIYALKANPEARGAVDRAWGLAPAVVRENKNFMLLAGGLLAAVLITKYVSSRN